MMMLLSKYISLREMGEEDRDTKRGVERLEREEFTRDGEKSVCLSYRIASHTRSFTEEIFGENVFSFITKDTIATN